MSRRKTYTGKLPFVGKKYVHPYHFGARYLLASRSHCIVCMTDLLNYVYNSQMILYSVHGRFTELCVQLPDGVV